MILNDSERGKSVVIVGVKSGKGIILSVTSSVALGTAELLSIFRGQSLLDKLMPKFRRDFETVMLPAFIKDSVISLKQLLW